MDTNKRNYLRKIQPEILWKSLRMSALTPKLRRNSNISIGTSAIHVVSPQTMAAVQSVLENATKGIMSFIKGRVISFATVETQETVRV